ncbi:MAG TPA: hypothetical protein VIK02_07690 [Candidatus Anoxymicrobiaceae bacterium]
MEHRVIAYSGCSYANEPREFFIDDEHHTIKKVNSAHVEQEQGLEGLTLSVWDVTDEAGARFRLTYHWVSDFWEIEPL